MRTKTTNFLMTLLMIFAGKSSGQMTLTLNQHISYFTNAFYNSEQLPDYYQHLGAVISYKFKSDKIQSQIYYNGDLNLFKNYSDRLFHAHSLGYDSYFREKSGTQYFFGFNGFWNTNQDTYSYFNSKGLSGYASLKTKHLHNLISQWGYNFKYKIYSELPEFSYHEHEFYSQWNTFFQSGTSLIFRAGYGLKNYIPVTGLNIYDAEVIEMPGVDQLVTSLKISQSLGAKTSVSARVLNQLNPGLLKGTASVFDADYLFTEDELFDDHYGYTGNEIYLTFTHYLPAYIKMEIGAGRSWKNYRNRTVTEVDATGAENSFLRKDTREIFWGEASRSFSNFLGMKNISMFLETGYLNNASNNPYYQFNNFYLTTGFRLGLH